MPRPLTYSALMATLPPEPQILPLPAVAKVVVLDDDPTGTQTVHGVPVLTTWDRAALEVALREPGPCFFILTNTRAFPADRAIAINREIGVNLQAAIAGRINPSFWLAVAIKRYGAISQTRPMHSPVDSGSRSTQP